MKLSILIPTIEKRKEMFNTLCDKLLKQIEPYGNNVIEILASTSPIHTIGAKRNKLLQDAEGEYAAFIDDDDDILDQYIDLLMVGIGKGVDCCSLKGLYSVNGVTDGIFEHSIKYKDWRTNNILSRRPVVIKYERYPNHLNCIKASIAKQFKFPEINHGEDKDWSTQIFESGLLKTEHYIPEIIYYYKKVTHV